MIKMIESWKGPVEINGTRYSNITEFISGNNALSGEINIKLYSAPKNDAPKAGNNHIEQVKEEKIYKITVKQYMTQKSEPGFDFMAKWNNDNPMPLRTMVGTIDKETRGMVHMQLKGMAEKTCTCLRCGKKLNNPTSRYYGIGPECMQKLGMIRVEIDDVEEISKRLTEVTWEGWIIKSAITKQEEIND